MVQRKGGLQVNLLWTELRKDAKGLREIGRWYRAEMMESAANEIDRLNARIKRLEEAGDKIVEAGWSVQDWSGMCVVWAKAKEDKP